MRVAPEIVLTEDERMELTKLAASGLTSVRLSRRSRLVLLAADGMQNREIAEQLGIGRIQVARWRGRYRQMRLAGHSCDHGTVSRHWRAAGLKPHIVRGFKISRDPKFVEKLEDIVGLYMSPPEHALVLCCDEKSQVQALDRTQPGLPLKQGRAATMTHDDKRNGTTTLFAALNVLDGQVIGQCQQRHTHAEWLKFLKKIDRETPKDKTLHLIADNYATHKHPVVQDWLTKHPRFVMHFTPTSAS